MPRLSVLGFLIAVAFGTLMAAAPAAPALASDLRSDMVAAANADRAAAGLAPLARSTEMDAVAQAWAEHLAAAGKLSHNPNYSSQIPGGWSRAGENVAMGYSDPRTMEIGWMNSPGHRANILGDYTHVGVAFVHENGTWGVQVFAKYPPGTKLTVPKTATATPVPVTPSPSKAPATPKPVVTPTASPAVPSPVATSTPAPSQTASTPGSGDEAAVASAAAAVPASDVRAATRGMFATALITLGALTLLFAGAAILLARRRRSESR